MQGIASFIRHLFGAMLKGFFFTGLAAAIACAAILFVTEPNHQADARYHNALWSHHRVPRGDRGRSSGVDLPLEPSRWHSPHRATLQRDARHPTAAAEEHSLASGSPGQSCAMTEGGQRRKE